MVRKRKTNLYELNEAYQKVLVWFFSFPQREIGLSDLAEALRISKTTANRVVKALEQEGFLKIEVIGRVWRISCSPNHIYNFSAVLKLFFWLNYHRADPFRSYKKRCCCPRTGGDG